MRKRELQVRVVELLDMWATALVISDLLDANDLSKEKNFRNDREFVKIVSPGFTPLPYEKA